MKLLSAASMTIGGLMVVFGVFAALSGAADGPTWAHFWLTPGAILIAGGLIAGAITESRAGR
jgi:hypothetical protein